MDLNIISSVILALLALRFVFLFIKKNTKKISSKLKTFLSFLASKIAPWDYSPEIKDIVKLVGTEFKNGEQVFAPLLMDYNDRPRFILIPADMIKNKNDCLFFKNYFNKVHDNWEEVEKAWDIHPTQDEGYWVKKKLATLETRKNNIEIDSNDRVIKKDENN